MKYSERCHVTIFVLERNQQDYQISYYGYEPVTPLADSLPHRIKGAVEFQGHLIPVVDLGVQFCDEPTAMTYDLCVLVIGHEYQGRSLYTAAIIGDYDEILLLSVCDPTNSTRSVSQMNMAFILELIETIGAERHIERLLGQNHLLLEYAWQRHAVRLPAEDIGALSI